MAQSTTQPTNTTGFSVTSLVTGIVGLLMGAIFWLSLPLAAVAITFAALTLRRKAVGGAKGMAIAGLVTGIIAALTGLFILMLTVIAATSAPTYYYY